MSSQNTPEPDALRFAAEWLRAYDDSHDGGAQSAIAESVAAWLDAQADAKELRDAAREHGVPVAKLRAALADPPGVIHDQRRQERSRSVVDGRPLQPWVHYLVQGAGTRLRQ